MIVPIKYWNYRVIRTDHTHADGEVETTLSIEEVHYEDGEPRGRTTSTPGAVGDSIEELRLVLANMETALNKPVLTELDFNHRENP